MAKDKTKRKRKRMTRKDDTDDAPCCKVESVIGIDGRGQIVIPKELRSKAKVKAGDKMAVVSWQKKGEVCCIIMIKADGLTKMVSGMLGPVVEDLREER